MPDEIHPDSSQLPLFGPPREIGGFDLRCHSAGRGGLAHVVCRQIPVDEGCDAALDGLLGALLPPIDPDREIWIKPNVTSIAKAEQGKTSSPEVLTALIHALVRAGATAARITVADCSVIGTDTYEAARACGILDACESSGVEFLDLRALPYERVEIHHSRNFAELHISEVFLRPDSLKINLAKIKTSYGSPAAFSIKNAKGLITDEEKLGFHLKGVQHSLCDLDKAVTWDLAVLEGFPASGLGSPVEWRVLVASDLPVAADLVACELAGIPLSDAQHLQLISEERGLETDELLRGLKATALSARLPKLTYTVNACKELERRHGVRILDGSPCSGCVESLSKALARRRTWPELGPPRELAVGAELRFEDLSRVSHFVGNCSFDAMAMRMVETNLDPDLVSSWEGAAKLAGCPPTIDAMAVIFGQPLDDVRARRFGERESQPFALAESHEDQLSREQFEILPLQIVQTAAVLQSLRDLVPGEKVEFTGLPRELGLRCELVAAGICHQMNWDFLRQRILTRAETNPGFFDLANLAECSPAQVAGLLDGYERPERVRASERAGMLRDIGWFVAALGDSLESIVDTANHQSQGPTGLRTTLERCSVFREDPERKKLNVLLHTMIRSGLWDCADQQELSPTIDYHIMRLLLRRGDVWPRSASYLRALRDETPQRALTATRLRRSVSFALREAAAQADMSVPMVNNIEWWVGRSVCTREDPGCEQVGPKAAWLGDNFGGGCPYRGHCVAYNQDRERLKLHEPLFEGRYY